MHQRTKLLLNYAKQNDFEASWIKVSEILMLMYCDNMKLLDVFHHVFAAFSDVKSEQLFEVNLSFEELITSPIKGFHSIDIFGCTKDTKYTVEQFYQSMISAMLGQLRIARVDWYKDELKD